MAAETDYTLNRKTGDVKQVGETNDKPDRILATNGKGDVKTDRKGNPKVAIDNIDKGILSDGMNLKTDSTVVSVGGNGNATKEGVERFALELADYVGREIGGAYFSNNGTDNVTHITLGGYQNNTYTSTKSKGISGIGKISNSMEEYNSYKVKGFFHTHPNESPRFNPSERDLMSRDEAMKIDPQIKSYILTHPANTGGEKPHIINFTNY
ncbi:hypothetical protein [Flavobacterium sp. HSC-61S13]|uniref:hypothetical protein n=1 Tax=Flavobacterium sp. HSC-61S13 TaxID=2910963 RepID=UPI00209D2956|nr:hypothetical protein [Flavobacterium sp. HSC-61S13]MCP1997184.1 hypothetical protein [Flavobacterium sp. HSC-61S13]